METSTWYRNPFEVEAVQVTEENMQEVAEWCGGRLNRGQKPDVENWFIKVRVFRAMHERQTMAFVGDWVLYAGTGYKVYTDEAFHKCFSQKEEGHPFGAPTRNFLDEPFPSKD